MGQGDPEKNRILKSGEGSFGLDSVPLGDSTSWTPVVRHNNYIAAPKYLDTGGECRDRRNLFSNTSRRLPSKFLYAHNLFFSSVSPVVM
jgi:hypothetical protein